jgi:hypothetical protein
MKGPFSSEGIVFHKAGHEIKTAIQGRCQQLRQRLDRRNATLNEFLNNRDWVRSYVIRSSNKTYEMHGSTSYILKGKDDISVEHMEEINQLCQRILELEQELRRLQLVAAHLNDDEQFDLDYSELVAYGFDLQAQ